MDNIEMGSSNLPIVENETALKLRLATAEATALRESLELSRAEFFNFFMVSPIPTLILALNGKTLKYNYEASNLMHDSDIDPDEQSLVEMLDTQSRGIFIRGLRETKHSEARSRRIVTTLSGKRIEITLTPTPSTLDESNCIIVTMSDISLHAGLLGQLEGSENSGQTAPLASRESRESRENNQNYVSNLLNSVIESTTDCLLVTDRSLNIVDLKFKGSFRPFFVRTPGVGLNLDMLFSDPLNRNIRSSALNCVKSYQIERRQFRISANDDLSHKFMSVEINQVGNLLVILLAVKSQSAEDMRKILENERLSLVGTMAAGLAHQFNNLHHPLNANLEEVIATTELPTTARQQLNDALMLGKKAASLTRSILGFAKSRNNSIANVNLKAIFKDVLNILDQTLLSKKIEVQMTIDDSLMVRVNAGQIEQVFINLLVNAVHAVLGRPERHVDIKTFVRGDKVFIEIKDTGRGIKPENISKIFDPLFTTKGEFAESSDIEQAKISSSGLGLGLCKQILEAHDSEISVQSEYGVGSTFTVTLPLGYGSPLKIAPKSETPQEDENAALVGKSILLVDDSKHVRMVAKMFLKKLKITVTEAVDGLDALDKCQDQQFDLILTDWRMPNLSGLEFLCELESKKLQSGVPILVVSAVEEDEAKGISFENRKYAFLPKPFEFQELSHSIRGLVKN